jgi:hypothetical protein
MKWLVLTAPMDILATDVISVLMVSTTTHQGREVSQGRRRRWNTVRDLHVLNVAVMVTSTEMPSETATA